MIKYTEDHEWLRIEGEHAVVGITRHAQDALGDVVFVELPEVGASMEQKAVAGVVESVKAAADVYMPNSDPMGAGWFFKVQLSQPAQIDALMDEAAYQSFSG